MKKNIAILGATGSVGSQAIDVARASEYGVRAVSANRNSAAVESIIREFRPLYATMADPLAAEDLKLRTRDLDVKIFSGDDGLCEMISLTEADTFVNAVPGFAGLRPTLDIIGQKKNLALANKESLVIAGDIVMQRAKENNIVLTPVDSEHSAIFQCLRAGNHNEIKKLIITASGGPFFGKTREELKKVNVRDALAHPNWKMGAEITIDSATLMNKGFEVIEASKLFSVPADKIEAVVHKESIVHSLVQFEDNAVIAQLSVPDMRLCVQYAVEYPVRQNAVINELDLCKIGALHFAKPDTETFSPLSLAFDALRKGGAMPAVLHAANECAVKAFLNEKIGFCDIFETLEHVCANSDGAEKCQSLEEILEADRIARIKVNEFISSINT